MKKTENLKLVEPNLHILKKWLQNYMKMKINSQEEIMGNEISFIVLFYCILSLDLNGFNHTKEDMKLWFIFASSVA